MQTTYLKINPSDSVVVCLTEKKKGDIIDIEGQRITLNQDTPAGHKVLIKDVAEGENIIKYGYPIGHALKELKAGDWVNEQNLKTNLSGTLDYSYNPVNEELRHRIDGDEPAGRGQEGGAEIQQHQFREGADASGTSRDRTYRNRRRSCRLSNVRFLRSL